MKVKEMFDEKDKDMQAVRVKLIVIIYIYKQLIQFTVYLKIFQSPNAQTLQDEILKL